MTAAALFILRRRQIGSDSVTYRVPGHPFTTMLFVVSCAAIVLSAIIASPRNSAIALVHYAGRAASLLFLEQIQTSHAHEHKHSDYMHWSKTQSRARFNLATSGVAPFPLRELPVHLETLEINGSDDGYGYPPLQKAIAAHHGVDPDCVVESAGTSMANHLAMASIIEPGDEVLIEHPAYGPILDVARYLHADVKRFPRTDETGWVVDPKAGSRLHHSKDAAHRDYEFTQSNKRAYARLGSAAKLATSRAALARSCWWTRFISMRFTNERREHHFILDRNSL